MKGFLFYFPDNQPHSGSGEEDPEVGVQDMTEMRFVPDDKGMLDAMFHAMSECQSLHPDPQDSFSEGLYFPAHGPEFLHSEAVTMYCINNGLEFNFFIPFITHFVLAC